VAELPIETPGGLIFAADLNADGTAVVLTEGGNESVIRRVDDGETTATLEGHTGLIQSVAFDSAGGRVLSASEDGTARVWDAATGRQLLSLSNDGNPVRSATWSADESLIATVGTNHQLRVWDAASGLEIFRVIGPDWAVGFSDDLSRIAAVDDRSGQLGIYACDVCGADLDRLEQLAEQRITRPVTPQERELYLDR
jgi:WD40 repeat protein